MGKLVTTDWWGLSNLVPEFSSPSLVEQEAKSAS
jgi:hypothetical protein